MIDLASEGDHDGAHRNLDGGLGHVALCRNDRGRDGPCGGERNACSSVHARGLASRANFDPRAQLALGRTLTIVAIGSSSTEGAGASSLGAAYPARLEALLTTRFPRVAIRVLNRGIGGEEETDMLARFERDVIAEKPDLVLWQVASNAIMRDRDLATEQALIRDGLARLKQSGADTVLIDPQYTPAVLAHAVALPMVDLIAVEARRHQVGNFRRFALMQNWRDKQRLPFDAFSIADGLHMNDWGYDCLARNLAAAIVEAADPAALASLAAAPSRVASAAGISV
ncbi:MAG TPA: SGNH/GDSL hydrolase family protein [Xanthobacteraceae bacterium]|nr:SGNH/GDSL hydrolase family protein [Xanthobacteraceae bacterium]